MKYHQSTQFLGQSILSSPAILSMHSRARFNRNRFMTEGKLRAEENRADESQMPRKSVPL